MMKELAKQCLEPEILELIRMYGVPKKLQTVLEIHSIRYQSIDYQLSTDIRDAVLKRLHVYGGQKQRLSQLLDEEQQRELEQELEEERQFERPPPATPCEPILYEETFNRLCDTHGTPLKLGELPRVFRRIAHAFIDTSFFNNCQPNSWQPNLWISTEFQRVVSTKGESLNSFLRPPRWTIVYRNKHIIFVSALEANWLMGRLKSENSPSTTLRLLLPRTKRMQSIFVNTPTLTVPPSIALPKNITPFFIPMEWLAQLFAFNGTLYFKNAEEQTAYCQCLGLCPKPRTAAEEEAFEKGWIAVDGFVRNVEHRNGLQIYGTWFKSNPLALVKQIIEIRNDAHAIVTSHVGSIILNSSKLI